MIKKIPTRKCLACPTRFKPLGNNHVVCSTKCATVKGNEAIEKKKAQLKKTEWTKEKAEIKESLKTHGDYLGILQAVFNTYIRLRDKDQPCISCGCTGNVKYDAGHLYSRKGYSGVRFDEDNVHKQCSNNCNMHLSGNFAEYSIKLPERIGLERFTALVERRHKKLELSIPEIKELIKHYKTKIKEITP